jgi:uncharacterized membrane protein YhaH (DUF805 family)
MDTDVDKWRALLLAMEVIGDVVSSFIPAVVVLAVLSVYILYLMVRKPRETEESF